MKKKKLSRKERLKIVEDSFGIGKIPWNQFTPGIYDYCDRWCEKCDESRKSKCFLFYTEEKEGIEVNDSKATLDNVKNSFTKTKDLIEKIAEAEGISLDISDKDEKRFGKEEKLTDPQKDHLAKLAKEITDMAAGWLLSVPSLDFDDYRESYDNFSWHHSLVLTKVYRAISSKNESEIESGDMKKFSLEDSKNSAWVALRSTTICKASLVHMDRFVGDARIKEMVEKYQEVINLIEQTLL